MESLLASKPLTGAPHEAASAWDKVLLSPPLLAGPCVSPSHVPGPVIAAISCRGRWCHTCGKGSLPPGRPFWGALGHFAFYRQENSAGRFGIFLRIMYRGSLKMLELIFPFLSLIDAPDIWVKEPRPQPCSRGGRNVSAQAVVSCYSEPNSQLCGASMCSWSQPAARRELSQFGKKQESLLVSRTSTSGARSRGGLGIASSPGCTEWSLWALLTLKTRGFV